ncbi:MAG: MHS family MFS transporter [Hyphomicrobium sp.]|nr:MHS family MFS transporter [Hyphomicrobium sp.]
MYGFLAAIIGKRFFPADDPIASLLAAFCVFALGYAARPIGGVVFGHLGDRLGRKPTLILSVALMGTATFAIGLLPDANQIGSAAAILLVGLRFIQGVSVGGESPTSIVFLAEHAPPEHRGFFTSWAQLGCLVGVLLGSGSGALTSTILGEEAMQAWGWRIPFLFGGVIAGYGYMVQRRMVEPALASEKQQMQHSPAVVAIRDHWRMILRVVCLILITVVGYYMQFVYAVSYLTEYMHISTARALDINTVAILTMLIVTLPAAILSDRLGRKPLLYFVAIGTLVLAWPLWWLIHQESFVSILAAQMGFAGLFGIGWAVVYVTMVEMLPTQVRCSGTAISFNLCLGLFGGTTPLIVTYLVARTADDFVPAYVLMAAGVLSFLTLLGLPERARKPLT